MNPELLLNRCLREHSHGRALAEIMAASLAAVEPAAAVGRALRREHEAIIVNGWRCDVRPESRVFVVGGGKAGAPMASAAHQALGERISAGLVIVKEGHLGSSGGRVGGIEITEAGHPVPDARGVAAAERMASLLRQMREADLVLALLSGGGSALLMLPAPGLALEDLQRLTEELLRCGATINEINTLRKHCTQLGGGGLAQLAAPARTATLIISDVVGSPLDVIASGPTVPDPTTFADAWRIIERYDLEENLSDAVLRRLRCGLENLIPETPKSTEQVWERVHNSVLASNVTAVNAALEAARERGVDATILTTSLEGEARSVGRAMAEMARSVAERENESKRLTLLIAGGETTVSLRGRGLGGRNQELALGAVAALDGLAGALLVTLATDGGDGPTDAAGACVTGETYKLGRACGLDPEDFLGRNDAYNYFQPLGALLRPGPTLTNVNDLLFMLIAPS